MHRHTYRITVAYDGSAFAGYGQQPGLRTVESTLMHALRRFVPDLPGVPCGGRTDRGVHALGQVVSFWSRAPLPLGQIRAAVDTAAPRALVARDVQAVPRSFHASFSASARHYAYPLCDQGELDVDRLNRLLEPLQGRRCFTAFARQHRPGSCTERRLVRASARRVSPTDVCFDFVATGFLRRQVRVMVATALRELRRGSSDDTLLRLCESGDRRATAPPADPDGLYLMRVVYA
jgi:tRNA pseudouridine38-40 synthase